MKKQILVIDDEPSICLLLNSFLSKTYDVVIKNNGREALDWLEGQLPDLIICDIDMPVMKGTEFLENLRTRGYTKHTPVIMLAAAESSTERVNCYRKGAQDFLAKPFNADELSELIKKNLEPIHYALKW